MFCVRLNVEPSDRKYQEVAVGIDPGSKKEAFTVMAEARTFLNIQADAVTWVSDKVKTRREMRRTRRGRKLPHRKNRKNRARSNLPPSTKARWQWKLRVLNWLRKMFFITNVVVEDVAAITKKGKRRWNASFSPLEVGKQWFYDHIWDFAELHKVRGWETAEMRNALGLPKTKKKLANVFSAHCVDSWVLANSVFGSMSAPENERMLLVTPLKLHRRQLHRLQPEKGGKRKPYGGTRSEGFKRGSIVQHTKHGITYVGGTLKGRISLHSQSTGRRLCQNAKPTETKFLAYSTWRTVLAPA